MGNQRTVEELTKYLKQFAPLDLAEDWDNVGLLVGDGSAAVSGVLTCLTLTPDVAAEAIEQGAQLIVSHHPIMFRPIQRITADDPQGKMVLDLIAAGVAVYSPHTGYDSAAAGINQQLAELLELQDIAPLRTVSQTPGVKIVVFVPRPHVEPVRQALWNAGAGEIGAYSHCSFASAGTGTFLGGPDTQPAIGDPGYLEQVEETRLEVICRPELADRAIAAMIEAHPYEEPAYDVFSLAERSTGLGSGRYGDLPAAMNLSEFNQCVKAVLGIENLQFVGNPAMSIRRVAIACGAAAQFMRDGRRLGCDALLTGEARFHDCLEARGQGMALVLPGHYATERPAMEQMAAILSEEFPELTVWASRIETDPLNWDC